MNSEVIRIKSENGLLSVEQDKIPEIVTSSIENILKLEKQVKNAEQSARKAMKYVDSKMRCYQDKGKWIFKHRSGNTKDIIEDTQEALEKIASAQQISVEALKQSFEFQRKLAETSKYLFELGCANIAVNRMTVRAIDMKLAGAGDKKISELAIQEMMAVVKQLKEQEDILKKQEFLTAKVKENVTRLNEKESIDQVQTERIDVLKSESKHQESRIAGIDEELRQKELVDKNQTERLEEFSAIMDSVNELDKKQEKAIESNRKSIQRNEKNIESNRICNKRIEQTNKSYQKEIESLHQSILEQKYRLVLVTSMIALIASTASIIMHYI